MLNRPLCAPRSRFAPFRGPGRPDQRKAVLGGLQVAHAVQRGSERRQQEEGPPVFRVPGSSLCSHRFRGTAAARLVTVDDDGRWSVLLKERPYKIYQLDPSEVLNVVLQEHEVFDFKMQATNVTFGLHWL